MLILLIKKIVIMKPFSISVSGLLSSRDQSIFCTSDSSISEIMQLLNAMNVF